MKRSTTNYQLLPISGRTMNRRNEDRQELIYPRQWRERTPSPSREPVEWSEFSVVPTEAQPTVVFRDLDRDTASIQAILMLWAIVDMWTVSLYSCLVLERAQVYAEAGVTELAIAPIGAQPTTLRDLGGRSSSEPVRRYSRLESSRTVYLAARL